MCFFFKVTIDMVAVDQIFSSCLLVLLLLLLPQYNYFMSETVRKPYFVSNKTLRQVANQVNRQEISSTDLAIKLLDDLFP
jgi:hypothetical protein